MSYPAPNQAAYPAPSATPAAPAQSYPAPSYTPPSANDQSYSPTYQPQQTFGSQQPSPAPAPSYSPPAPQYQPPSYTPPPAAPAPQQQYAPPQQYPAPAPSQPGFAATYQPPAQQPAAQPAPPPAPTPAAMPQYTPEQLAELERYAYAGYEAEQSRRAAPAHAPETPKRGPWDALDYDETLTSHATWSDEHGRYVPKDQWSNRQAVERLNEIHAERQRRILDLSTKNPADIVFEAGGREKIVEILRNELQDFAASQQRASLGDQFLSANRQYMYVPDGRGDIARDQMGQPILTDYGRNVAALCAELESSGVTDLRHQIQWVQKLLPPPVNGNGNGAPRPGYQALPAPYAPAPQQQYAPNPYAPQPYAPPYGSAPPSAYPPAQPQPSQQDLFLRRAEFAYGQNPGYPAPQANGTLVADASNLRPPPQSPQNLDGFFLKSAIAQGLVPAA